ncbi:MAG: hypothetical protein ACOCWM_01085 [Cyclobacteriaceae bacterium]
MSSRSFSCDYIFLLINIRGAVMPSDHSMFNCNQEHELRYVSGKYAQEQEVYNFLKKKCADGTIFHFTHQQVYDLIKKELGYEPIR